MQPHPVFAAAVSWTARRCRCSCQPCRLLFGSLYAASIRITLCVSLRIFKRGWVCMRYFQPLIFKILKASLAVFWGMRHGKVSHALHVYTFYPQFPLFLEGDTISSNSINKSLSWKIIKRWCVVSLNKLQALCEKCRSGKYIEDRDLASSYDKNGVLRQVCVSMNCP